MRITNGNKQIDIPNWAIFVGVVVADNIIANVCKVVDNRNLYKAKSKAEKDEESQK